MNKRTRPTSLSTHSFTPPHVSLVPLSGVGSLASLLPREFCFDQPACCLSCVGRISQNGFCGKRGVLDCALSAFPLARRCRFLWSEAPFPLLKVIQPAAGSWLPRCPFRMGLSAPSSSYGTSYLKGWFPTGLPTLGGGLPRIAKHHLAYNLFFVCIAWALHEGVELLGFQQ